MFKNYLTIAIRNLLKHKGYSLINILGLAIGMACCVLILLYVQDELSYDRYHEKAGQIYRVAESGIAAGKFLQAAVTPPPWAPLLVRDYPEVLSAVRIKPPNSRWLIKYGEKRFYEKGFFFADSTVFDIFTFPLLQGNPKTALTEPYSVVLTEAMVEKYFGDEDPLGKIITGDNTYDFKVTGVLQNIPKNSHLHFDFLASYATLAPAQLYGEPSTMENQGFNHSIYTYLLLQKGYPPEVFNQKLLDFIETYLGDQLRAFGFEARPYLQPVTDIHLHSNLEAELETNSDIRYVYLFSALAVFILLIACINFMNLATARSANRAQEVGMRKVVGARRLQLIQQFMGESVLLSGIALLMTVVLVDLLLPLFNDLSGKQLVMDYRAPWLVPGLLGIALLVGIIAGGYPALFLSAFQPVVVLKGRLKAGSTNALLRKVLVVIQFAISIIMIIGTGIVSNQLAYIRNKKLGFDKEHVVVIRMPDQEVRQGYPSFKNTLLQNAHILGVATSTSVPGGLINISIIQPEGIAQEQSPAYQMMIVDYDFIPLLGIELAAGRNFSLDFPSDTTACLINEATVRELGWEEPLGKTFQFPRPPDAPGEAPPPFRVIGVVRDFHNRSLHQKIEPLMLLLGRGGGLFMLIKIPGNNVSGALDVLRNQWRETYPNHPALEYTFLDEDFDNLYKAEQRLRAVFGSFSFLSIFIACLGLFGLASFMAEQRTKEIGVRKVMGASVFDIVFLLSRDFTRLVLFAFVVATPVVYYTMNQWLREFPYHIDIGIWTFVLAGVAALVIAWFTVGYQALKASLTNPVEALRYE